eukprot:3569042-Amphidinium_carterae.1
MATAIAEAWKPMWTHRTPNWQDIAARYPLPSFAPLPQTQLTVSVLQEAAASMKKGRAVGADGIRIDDLEHLTPQGWQALAHFYEHCERARKWPQWLSIHHV